MPIGIDTTQVSNARPEANVDKGDYVTGAEEPRSTSRNAQRTAKHHQNIITCANSSAMVNYTWQKKKPPDCSGSRFISLRDDSFRSSRCDNAHLHNADGIYKRYGERKQA